MTLLKWSPSFPTQSAIRLRVPSTTLCSIFISMAVISCIIFFFSSYLRLIDEHFGFQKNSAKSNRMALNPVNFMARQYRRWRNRTTRIRSVKNSYGNGIVAPSPVENVIQNLERLTAVIQQARFCLTFPHRNTVTFLQRVRIRNGKRKTAHCTIVFGQCKGVLCNTLDRFESQKQHFCLLTTPRIHENVLYPTRPNETSRFS